MSRPFIVCTDVARVEMIYNLFGEVVENQFHVWREGHNALEELTITGEIFALWWNEVYKNDMTLDLVLNKVVVTSLDAEPGTIVEVTTGLPSHGPSGDRALPGNVAACIKLNSGYTGRSNRGRTYIPGISKNVVAGNELLGVWVTAIIADLVELKTRLAAEHDRKLVIASFRTEGVWRGVCDWKPVVSFSVSDYTVDSQRRRLHTAS